MTLLNKQAQQYKSKSGRVVEPLSPTGAAADQNSARTHSPMEETAYRWNIESGDIQWESNACEILGLQSEESIARAESFHSIIAAEHVNRRLRLIEDVRAKSETGQADAKHGVSYRVQYRIQTGTRGGTKNLWLEDNGRWWPATSGDDVEQARGVIRVITEQYWEEQRLLYHADQDELTGQLNRVRLTEAVAATISRAERLNESVGFLIVSVDNLGVINESFGFDVGDEVISAVARNIKDKLRGGDSIGRYSSNKFGIILNDCGPPAMRVVAERFIKSVREAAIRTTACQLSASVSVGGVTLPDQASTAHQAFNHALQALDRAKKKRANSFMAYEPNPMRESTRQRNISIVDDVISALDEHRMRLVLQPLVNARTGAHKIYECLLRMEMPDGEIVSAGQFIPVAEQLGLSRLIDMRTLEMAIELLREYPELHLSLNVSSLTAHDRDWMLRLHELTNNRRDFTERLIIEITETAAIHDLDQTVAFVDTLKELGCRVAIDDFGAGYTSFKNLKHLNVDIIKIDGAFVKDIIADKSDRVFIKTMIDLANEFNMETVAEWVGDEETAQFLRDAGITYLQGFLYGMPIATEDYAQSA